MKRPLTSLKMPCRLAVAAVATCSAIACGGEAERVESVPEARADSRPNVLWVVWDTVRADRLSLYGHDRKTTPHLDEWAASARVYDNAISIAGYTLPSHASMFTGMLPSQHCTNNDNKRLSQDHTTIAEILSEAGYSTYLFAANPNLSHNRQFTQGFDLAEYPWSERYYDESLRIVSAKAPPDDVSSTLPRKIRAAAAGKTSLTPWNIKAAGEMAERALLNWLETTDPQKPFFAFLNYMEAHRPVIPSAEARARMMSEADVARSYEVDRAWLPMWEYTFGLRDYSPDEMELTRATYDATLTELDVMFHDLVRNLEAAGRLDNTIVILTSDHGEHLGEQHMLDHQFSLYQALLRVPLVIHFPDRFAPGRDSSPVMNFDLFPTLLDLTGTVAPASQQVGAVSLLEPQPQRRRLSEDPSGSDAGWVQVQSEHLDWDSSPWDRKLRALFEGGYKYIWSSRGEPQLFDVEQDPLESQDLLTNGADEAKGIAAAMDQVLRENFEPLVTCLPVPPSGESVSADERHLLKALGYVVDEDPTAGGENDQP